MAKRKKSRTPAPPTKGRGGRKTTIPGHVTQASGPRQKESSSRTSPLSNLNPRQLRFLLAGAVGLVIIVVVVIAISLSGGSSTGGPGEALAAAGCQLFEPAPGQATAENNHVLELPEGFEYNTFPPSQGPHHPETLLFNLYPEPVEQLNLVHNLEHGGMYIQYGDQVSGRGCRGNRRVVGRRSQRVDHRPATGARSQHRNGCVDDRQRRRLRELGRAPRLLHQLRSGRVRRVQDRLYRQGPGAIPRERINAGLRPIASRPIATRVARV